MDDDSWLHLTSCEHAILLEAVGSMLNAGAGHNVELENLAVKLVQTQPHPDITVGVHSGLVQWIVGNPFPIRVCDYDGFDLADVDERGRACDIRYEEPNANPIPE
jgi:hypothetical protein